MWRLMDERGMRGGVLLALWLVIAGCGGGGGSDGSNIGVSARVPNVVGQTQAAAATSITGAGLNVGTVTMATSSSVAAGNVISQNPAAGALVAPASTVDIVVSSGVGPTVAVPNVVGQTQAAASTTITNAGLRVGTVTNAASTTVPSGNVISQTPASGTSVAANSAVNLTVSSGANPAFGINTRPPVANFTLPSQRTAGHLHAGRSVSESAEFRPSVFLTAGSRARYAAGRRRADRSRARLRAVTGDVNYYRRPERLVTDHASGGEQGLLGFAFDPDFATNHFFYVYYTRSADGATVDRALHVGSGTNTANLVARRSS